MRLKVKSVQAAQLNSAQYDYTIKTTASAGSSGTTWRFLDDEWRRENESFFRGEDKDNFQPRDI